ncbi:MAG: serine/threonine-protein kinase, partial [Acidobacteriota bacterium]
MVPPIWYSLPAMSLQKGTRIGSYEIVGSLGQGGMGEVYRAKDFKLKREVAIKRLTGAVAQDPDRIARFEREAQVLASLNHPNIAAIYGLVEHEGGQCLVLELVEGRTLEERLQEGAFDVQEATAIGLQVIAALEAAHGKGIIHRDLKPANIKVGAQG